MNPTERDAIAREVAEIRNALVPLSLDDGGSTGEVVFRCVTALNAIASVLNENWKPPGEFDPRKLREPEGGVGAGPPETVVFVPAWQGVKGAPFVTVAHMERTYGTHGGPVVWISDNQPVPWDRLVGKVYPVEAFPRLAAEWMEATRKDKGSA